MAGDWIAVDHEVSERTETVMIATEMDCEIALVVGRLTLFWCYADKITVDGFLSGMTCAGLARKFGGDARFWQCVADKGWATVTETGIQVPNFSERFGESARRRLKERVRKARFERERGQHDTKKPPKKALAVRGKCAGSARQQQLQQQEDNTNIHTGGAPKTAVEHPVEPTANPPVAEVAVKPFGITRSSPASAQSSASVAPSNGLMKDLGALLDQQAQSLLMFSTPDEQFKEFMRVYPRKSGPKKARDAWDVCLLELGETWDYDKDPDGPGRFLIERARTYANSPAGQQPLRPEDDFRYVPANWLSGGHYDDDAKELLKPNRRGAAGGGNESRSEGSRKNPRYRGRSFLRAGGTPESAGSEETRVSEQDDLATVLAKSKKATELMETQSAGIVFGSRRQPANDGGAGAVAAGG